MRFSKYGNHRVGNFSSKLEAAVHQVLMLREKSGEIRMVKTQAHVRVCCPQTQACDSKCKITYIADFECQFVVNGETFHAEAKGMETDTWRLKRRLWMHNGPGTLEVWMGNHTRPFLKEIIIPKGEIK